MTTLTSVPAPVATLWIYADPMKCFRTIIGILVALVGPWSR
jgi:hypothetical protein